MLIFRPICQNDFISTFQYGRSYVSLVVVDFKITDIFFNDVSVQIKIDSTFTAVTGLVLDNKELFTINFVANSFTCP